MKKKSPSPSEPVPAFQQPLLLRTWFLACASSLLLWAAFPPFDLWPLAWLAPVPWLLLIGREKLSGKRPYLQIAAAGMLHWLLMLQGVRLAHPALYGGWVALSAYLAMYLVLFISISRVAVHRLRLPLIVAAPIVWVGLEYLRSNLISGFACGLLAHTQTAWPLVLQIADLGGGYAVSFVMMLVAAAVTQYLPARRLDDASIASAASRGFIPLAVAASVLVLSLGYGWWRLHEDLPADMRPPLRVALIQGSLDTKFDQPFAERVQTTLGQYDPLTREAIQKQPNTDLVVWPESMLVFAEFFALNDAQATDERIPQEHRGWLAANQQQFQATQTGLQRSMPGSYFLFGTSTLHFDLAKEPSWPEKNYNAALLATPDGKLAGRYYKMHPVMFGEFIPLTDLFPFLYRLTPMAGGMSIGERPTYFEVKGLHLAPNICFESTVPHLIREQIVRLENQRSGPIDAIVNVSNDGWFKGSSILDLHFRCSVFRAIENRKPVIIAANTGISAHIDGNGRILQRGPKRKPTVLLAEVRPDGRSSPYHLLGDVGAFLCATATWIVALYATWRR